MTTKLTVRELRELLFNVKNQDAIVIGNISDGGCEDVVSKIIGIKEEDNEVFLCDMYTKKSKIFTKSS